MGDRLQRRLAEFDAVETVAAEATAIDTRARLIVTLVYLVSMLSLPLTDFADLLLFGLYPIIGAAASGIRFSRLLRRSLVALPFVLLVGIFNPLFDTEPAFMLGGRVVSRGWVTFASIVLRGMLSVQAVMLMLLTSGFFEVCRAMGRLGVPPIFTSQLLFVYRYIFVVAADGATLKQAVDARRFSRKTLPIRVWGAMVGQLLVRSLERAERVGAAMQARGFDGRFRSNSTRNWTLRDTVYTVALGVVFIGVRTVHPSTFFNLL